MILPAITDVRRYASLALREQHAEHVISTLELLHPQQQHLAETIDHYRDLVRLAGPDPVAAGGDVRAHWHPGPRGHRRARGTAWTCC